MYKTPPLQTKRRHCERSEAIQYCYDARAYGLPRRGAPRNDKLISFPNLILSTWE